VLPAYRGAAPIQWAIIRGETETGVTIMQLDEGMDTGPMLLVKREPIRGEDTAGTLSERLAALGAEALIETLAAIEAGTARAVPQDDSRASYAPILKKEDGRVDWSRPAREVRDRIRGVDPWPGATAAWEGAPLKLFGAALADAVPPGSPRTPTLPVDQDLIIGGAGAPGQVQAVGPAGLVVVCGEGAVRIAELQAPGRRRMPAADLARGRRLSPGVVLA
jgi:methionyl-tRNA formyltransferase